jgi:hypothetical protein
METRCIIKEWSGGGELGGVVLGNNELKVCEAVKDTWNRKQNSKKEEGGKGLGILGPLKVVGVNKFTLLETPDYVVAGLTTTKGNVISGVPIDPITWVRAVNCEAPDREGFLMLVYITKEFRWGGLGGSIRRLGYCDTWVKRISDERERLRRLSARRGNDGVNFGIFGLFGSTSTPKIETLDIRELPNLKERVQFLIGTVLRGSEDAVNELHGLGYRHGSLGEDSVLLKRVNEGGGGRKEPPGTVRECRGGGVKVAFQDLGKVEDREGGYF